MWKLNESQGSQLGRRVPPPCYWYLRRAADCNAFLLTLYTGISACHASACQHCIRCYPLPLVLHKQSPDLTRKHLKRYGPAPATDGPDSPSARPRGSRTRGERKDASLHSTEMSYKFAYATLLTKTSYLPGTLVLEHTLRLVGSRYPLVVMATPELPQDARGVLERRGIKIVDVDNLQPEEGVHSLGGHDARFKDTWTKLCVFNLVDYERVVLLDSDMLTMRNMDELMELDLPKDWIAAAHACACNPRKFAHYPADWIPENCAYTSVAHPTGHTIAPVITESSPRPYNLLNSGMFVLSPSIELYKAITHYLVTSPLVPTFSFPDQDLLATFFEGKWKPVPWCYNALKTLKFIHKPLWRDEEVRCLHYIFADKPWCDRAIGGDYEELHGWWWDAFNKLGEEMEDRDREGWSVVSSVVA